MRRQKAIASIIIILIVIVVAAVVLQPFFKPDMAKAGLEISSDGKGKLYITERHADTSYVYRVDEKGNIDAAITLPYLVMSTKFMGDKVYGVVFHDEEKTWSLDELSADLTSYRVVASGGYDLIGSIRGFSSSKDRVFLVGNGTTGNSIVILSYDPSGQELATDDFISAEAAGVKGMSVFKEVNFPIEDSPVDFTFDGEALYALHMNGKISKITDDTDVSTEDTYLQSILYCRQSMPIVLDKERHEISLLDNFPKLTPSYTYDRLTPGSATVWTGGAAMLAQDTDGKTNIYFANEDSTNTWKPVYEYHIPLKVQMKFMDYPPTKIWIITIALAIAFIFSMMLAIYVRRLVLRVCATISVLGCFMLAVLCSLVWILSNDISLKEVDAASGGVIHEYLAPEVVQVRVAFEAFTYGGITLIIAIAVAIFFTGWSLRPLRDLTKRIGKFIEGDFTVDAMVSTTGDLGRMSRAVTEMGVSLAIKQYETDRMVESYSRFVPRDADRLLERASIMEVGTGDVARVEGCIATVSVENRENVMRIMDSRGFMAFVNSCFARIFECANKYKGALLSGEFLAALPILFSEQYGANHGDSIRFGLDLIDHMTTDDGKLPAPDFFMLLHTTDFLYGIAGTQEKAFPFISSAELNYLYNCNSGLRKLGIRIAATQEYLDNLAEDTSDGEQTSKFAKRYIGMIQTPDVSREYQIYEMLDCLSDRERDLRINYDSKVQDAIKLFYKNDFYPAMVAFSSILNLNPRDGLVRWYAFACEKYFNEGKTENIRYDLLHDEGK
jgi:hypothetical protein